METTVQENSPKASSLLRQADKLVKEDKYDEALNLIQQAQALQPKNLYAIAYEEYVREKRHAVLQKNGSSDLKREQKLDQISIMAYEQTVRQEDIQQKKENAERTSVQEEFTSQRHEQAIADKITTICRSAKSLAHRGLFSQALDEIGRGYMIDPVNEQLDECEKGIRETFKRSVPLKVTAENKQQIHSPKKPSTERETHELLLSAYKEITHGHINSAIALVNQAIQSGGETAKTKELLNAIDQYMREEQSREQEYFERKKKEYFEKKEKIVHLVKNTIDEVPQLLRNNDIKKAKDIVREAMRIDPLNSQLKELSIHIQQREIEIRSEAEKQLLSSEETLRTRQVNNALAYAHNGGSGGEKEITIHEHLQKAQSLFQQCRFEDAMGEVALALIISPEHLEAKQLEYTISKERKKIEEELFAQTFSEIAETNAVTVEHLLSEAKKLYDAEQYNSALDEITKAFVIDPLNKDITATEKMIRSALRKNPSTVITDRGSLKNFSEEHFHASQILQNVDEIQKKGDTEQILKVLGHAFKNIVRKEK
jgi:tetratricopeptide (TPR) repeat protein